MGGGGVLGGRGWGGAAETYVIEVNLIVIVGV